MAMMALVSGRIKKNTELWERENENEGDFYKNASSRLSRDTYLVPVSSSLCTRVGNWEVREDWHEDQIKM